MSSCNCGPYRQKYSALITRLESFGSAVLAYSGGVDSSFLLRAMQLSGMRFLAVIGSSETVPARDLNHAVSFAQQEKADYRVISTEEMQNPDFVSNPPDRCFHCKKELFQKLRRIAGEEGYSAVFDGSNADDLEDYRPGRKAAELFGIQSPLAESGLTKDDIRRLSKELGLPTWDKPSSPCLSSRFPYGMEITAPVLRRIEKAEDFLRELGVSTVRVRVHHDVARIEVPSAEMSLLMEYHLQIAETLKSFGFRYVSLDLEGFRSGSLNRTLTGEVSGSSRVS